jgi:hypothetical protein
MKLLICICLLLPVFISADCGNGIKDANEADVDCGKDCFALCQVDKMCSSDFDCESWKCKNDVCVEDDQTVRFLAASGAAAAKKKVVQTATLTGITKAQFESKKTEIEAGIAEELGLSADMVSVRVLDSRRRNLESGLKIEITVLVADETAATAMETKLKPSTFKSTLVQKISNATGINATSITAVVSAPKVEDATAGTNAPSPATKGNEGDVSASETISSTALMVVVALVLNVIVSQYSL